MIVGDSPVCDKKKRSVNVRISEKTIACGNQCRNKTKSIREA
jgi:hypothetical protein